MASSERDSCSVRSKDAYPPLSVTLCFTDGDVALFATAKCSVVSSYVIVYIKEHSVQQEHVWV
jgi:hypothetical protein